MRSRAPVALLACIAGFAATPAVASAAEAQNLAPYSIDATPTQVLELAERGFDIEEGGAVGDSGIQEVEIVATQKQIAALEKEGLEAEALSVDAPKPKSAPCWRQPEPVLQRLPLLHGERWHRRRDEGARGRQPRRHEA